MNYLISTTIVFASLLLSRFAELPANVTPILAAAVFAPLLTKNIWAQWLLPVSVMFVSDFVLGFYSAAPVVYSCVMLASIIGAHVKNVYTASVVSVFAWHIIVNGAVWFYGAGTTSLLATYISAIPFDFRLLCSTLLFVFILDTCKKSVYNSCTN